MFLRFNTPVTAHWVFLTDAHVQVNWFAVNSAKSYPPGFRNLTLVYSPNTIRAYWVSVAPRPPARGAVGVRFPIWPLTALPAIGLAQDFLRRAAWRRRVRRLDLCAACGYNLTGNVSGVCPESGRLLGESEPVRAA